jgi:hypothetical protein
MESSSHHNWRVEIVENGRSGNLIYHEDSWLSVFCWEFGAGDVVAIIDVGKPSEWNVKYPVAADRRGEILDRVSSEVIRRKAKTCIASYDDKSGTILLRDEKRNIRNRISE